MKRNESVCSIAENVIFTLAGFDAPQMNFVSKSCIHSIEEPSYAKNDEDNNNELSLVYWASERKSNKLTCLTSLL